MKVTRYSTTISRMWLMMLPVLVSACVHEFPQEADVPDEPEAERVFRLHLRYDSELPLLGIYDYEDGKLSPAQVVAADVSAQHNIRYIIKAYPVTRDANSRTATITTTYLHDLQEGLDATFDLSLPPGDYRLIVWTDYTDSGSKEDKYYDTTDFAEVAIADRDNYPGGNPWRLCYYGSLETSISCRSEVPEIDIVGEATIDMECPLAKYSVISTDLSRFTAEDYLIRFVYPRYVPYAFNCFTGRAADSWLGVWFDSYIVPINADEAEIGFDYIFVNPDLTGVDLAVQVLSPQGDVLASIPTMNIPLLRDHLTVVKGEFLTAKGNSFVGINPDFNGSFNIEIK